MKKTAAILLALMLMFTACALAFEGKGYPVWDGSTPPENSLCGRFGQDALKLDFDPTGEYSAIEDGLMQVCFFAFDSNEQYYLEFYFLLPANLNQGGVYTPANLPEESSLFLYEVSQTGEELYFAGIYGGKAFPDETSFEIRIDDLDRDGSTLHVRGSFNARMAKVSPDYKVIGSLELSGMQFDFTMPLSPAAAPAATPTPGAGHAGTPKPFAPATPAPSQAPGMPMPTQAPASFATPKPTLDPHPAFTLPPDYREL